MPLRLDHALWGASLILTLGRRAHLLSSTPSKYLWMKYITWVIDYSSLGFMVYLFEMYLSTNFTAQNVVIHQVMNTTLALFVDILKAIMFAPLLPKVKIEHLKHLGKSLISALFTIEGIKGNFSFLFKLLCGQGTFFKWDEDGMAVRKSVRHHIWYFVKIAVFWVPLSCAAHAHYGFFSCEPLNETIMVVGEGEWYECHISRFLIVYAEFLVMAFIKDGISMSILHQMFHSQFYDLHKTHHIPRKELTLINLFFFDIFDLVVEDGVAPMLVIAVKALGGAGIPTVHYMAYYFLVMAEINTHSVNAYTAAFWNPLLDNCMRPTISHNLHHALNTGHFTLWPTHHLIGVKSATNMNTKASDGFEADIEIYNKTFETSFPLNL